MRNNFKVVNVRKEHTCKKCGRKIKVSEKALTVNPKQSARYWVCKECIEKYQHNASIMKRMASTKAEMNSLPFGDEGAAWAMISYMEYLESQIEE